MKTLFSLAALVTSLVAPTQAHAIVGYCSIQGSLQIESAYILVGGSEGIGSGDILCTNLDGSTYSIPVMIFTKAYGLGLGAASVQATLSSAGLGVMNSGYDFLGDYVTVKGSAQVLNLGGEVGVSLTAKRAGFSLPLDLKMTAGPGLELAVGIGSITIALDQSRLY